jgi:hypothetical protein
MERNAGWAVWLAVLLFASSNLVSSQQSPSVGGSSALNIPATAFGEVQRNAEGCRRLLPSFVKLPLIVTGGKPKGKRPGATPAYIADWVAGWYRGR